MATLHFNPLPFISFIEVVQDLNVLCRSIFRILCILFFCLIFVVVNDVFAWNRISMMHYN